MPKDNKSASSMQDHDYDLAALREAYDEELVEEMEEGGPTICLNDHTPLPSPDPRRMKKKDQKIQDAEVSNANIYDAIQVVLKRFDDQDKRFKKFEILLEANTKAVTENKKEIGILQGKIEALKKENIVLKDVFGERQIQEKMESKNDGLTGKRQGHKRGSGQDPNQNHPCGCE